MVIYATTPCGVTRATSYVFSFMGAAALLKNTFKVVSFKAALTYSLTNSLVSMGYDQAVGALSRKYKINFFRSRFDSTLRVAITNSVSYVAVSTLLGASAPLPFFLMAVTAIGIENLGLSALAALGEVFETIFKKGNIIEDAPSPSPSRS